MAFMTPTGFNQHQQVLDTVRNLSGIANNFVPEQTVLNTLYGVGVAPGVASVILNGLVQSNRLECYAPMPGMNQLCGCGGSCGGACGGSCGGGCCGCGRYYRIKIG
uniref:Uncharacterized protein n=1 Tax=Cacopsylla melanoneura TaxID=428564 RepID=A0A8D9E8Q9_9HEMI